MSCAPRSARGLCSCQSGCFPLEAEQNHQPGAEQKMSTPATPDDFLKLVQKSGLIEDRKLDAFAQTHEHDGLLRGDVKKLAARMVRDGLITYFHGEEFLLGKWRGFTLGKFKL